MTSWSEEEVLLRYLEGDLDLAIPVEGLVGLRSVRWKVKYCGVS